MALVSHLIALILSLLFVLISAWILRVGFLLRASFSQSNTAESETFLDRETGTATIAVGWISFAASLILFGLSLAALLR